MRSSFDPMVAVCSATRRQCRNITAAGLHLLNLMDDCSFSAGLHLLNLMDECSFLRSLALELLGHCVLDIRDNKHFYDHG